MNDTLRQQGVYILFFCFGAAAGALGMIEHYENRQKPVVTVEQDGASVNKRLPESLESVMPRKTSDAAPPLAKVEADEVRHLQRVKELRFSLEKLERTKAVQDAFLKHAANNRDDIREMVAKLGEVGK